MKPELASWEGFTVLRPLSPGIAELLHSQPKREPRIPDRYRAANHIRQDRRLLRLPGTDQEGWPQI